MALVGRAPCSITDETNTIAIQTTPFESLPAELISLIASYLVPQTFIPFDGKTSNIAELLMASHICRHWRVAILNDPRLWTKIEVCNIFLPQPRDSAMLAKILALSGNLALDANMEFLRESNVSNKMLDQILNQSERCAALSIAFSSFSMFNDLLRKDCEFPNLRRLSLMPNWGFWRQHRCDSEELWRRLPRLEVLELMSDITHSIRELPLNNCLPNLKTVIIEILDTPGDASHIFFPFIDMLASSKTIISATFRSTCCAADSDFLDRNPVGAVSNSIETLDLKDYGVRLLHHMSFPSLRTLSVDTLKWKTTDIPAQIVDATMPCIIGFLDRSSPPLKKFTLAIQEFTPSILPSMLPHLQRLTYFTLCVHVLSNLTFFTEFFDELSRNNDGTFAVVPHLKRLDIRLNADLSAHDYDESKQIDEMDRQHFDSMIRERTSHSAEPSFRTVTISVDTNKYYDRGRFDVEGRRQYERRREELRAKIAKAGWIRKS